MKIVLNIATHGDEQVGFKVAKEVSKLNLPQGGIIVQVANKKAADIKQRFIEQDLNRSFPGKKNGKYEERLAYKLSAKIRSADIVIDVHSTTSDLKDALIVTKLDNKTLQYVKAIQPKYLLLMNATKSNALISQAKVGIAFEYGKDNDSETCKKTVMGIKRLLKCLELIELKIPKANVTTKYFDVIATVPKPDGYFLTNAIKNYKLIKKGTAYATNGDTQLFAEEDFYPVLFGEKKYIDYFGFMAKKIAIDH